MNDQPDGDRPSRPHRLDREKEQAVKKRGILLASSGLLLALGVVAYFRAVGLTDVPWSLLAGLAAATLLVQAVLWLIPHLGWDRYLEWDDDYVLVPLLAAAMLLLSCAAVVPEARYLLLIGWFAALLFGLRFLGFWQVVGLGILVTGLYVLVLPFHWGNSAPLYVTLRIEAGHVGALLAIHLFAGEEVMPAGLTVSLGLASFPEHAESPDELIQAGDSALYEAKEAGRNRGVAFGEDSA